MRIQPWMTVLASVAMLFAAQTTSWGQGYPPATAGPYQPPYGNTNPDVMYPAGTPAGMQPWPGISPYQSANIAETSLYNQNGSWLKEILYRDREYFGSLEAVAIKYRGAGSALIGSPYQALNGQGFIEGVSINQPYNAIVSTGNTTTSITTGIGTYPVDPRVFPYPALDASTNTYVTVTAGAFPIWTARKMSSPDFTLGVQGRWGYANEDGTGTLMSGWWGGQSLNEFQRGQSVINGVPVTQALTLTLAGSNLNTRYGNIPLDNGEFSFATAGSGSTAKYDVLFRIAQSTQAGGANISRYARPIYKSNGLKIRPMWGIRYTYIQENFSFQGIDSGFNYDYDGSDDNSTFAPSSPLTLLYDQYQAVMRNEVKSHIAGPEIGLRFDLGSGKKGLDVWAESIFGLNAYYEEIQMAGDKIGDPLVDARFSGLLVPRLLDPTSTTTFHDQNKGTHLSPLFQQSVFADLNLFGYLPMFKKMDILEDAKLRLGYTLLYVGEVARPADAINWKGFPLFPSIRDDRQTWYAQQFNIGIDWRY